MSESAGRANHEQGAPVATGTVAVGVDGSEGSRRALRWAAAEARLRGAGLRVVQAWTYLDQPGDRFDPTFAEDDVRRQLQAELDAIGPEAEGLAVELVAVCDLPVRGLLDASDGADLLVVGARGLGGFEGLLLGSVSQQVAHHARGPVVIVPGEERATA
ncbi:MAG TPA: universal stress protein [Acidimicrobiales bacterium]|nr:universal stress protein [Acidimicrobiales bacterium]